MSFGHRYPTLETKLAKNQAERNSPPDTVNLNNALVSYLSVDKHFAVDYLTVFVRDRQNVHAHRQALHIDGFRNGLA